MMRHWLQDQSFRSLVRNTSYLALSKGVAAIAGIATLAFAGRTLGLVQFGLLVLVGIPLLWMLGFPLTPMLYALDRPDAPLKARAVGTVVYLAIIAPLCWRYDVAGAASAMLIGNFIIVALMTIHLRIQYRRVRGG